MSKLTLKAEERKLLGRKVKKLRKEGILPANLYGKKVKSLSLQVDLKDFQGVYDKAGETGLVELVIGKSKKPVLIHEVQVDPVTDNPIHTDFLQVNLKEKVTANVPIELVGTSPADRQGLGILVQQLEEIEVEALPNDLPDKFEVDISGLEKVDSSVVVADLKYDAKKIEVSADKEQIIAKVEPLREEEEEEPSAPAEGEEGEVEKGEKETTGDQAGEEKKEEKSTDKDKASEEKKEDKK